MTDLYRLLVESASAACQMQNSDGSMPGGCNGPYNHPETRIRNTGHWIVTWRKAYELDPQSRFRRAARKAVDFILLENERRPAGGNFIFRAIEGRDKCNGVIGAGWLMESLVAAHEFLDDERALSLAQELHRLHPWDERTGLWQRVDDDGTVLPFDLTFNHQLWFALGASFLIPHCAEARAQVDKFLDAMPRLPQIRRGRPIVHKIAERHVRKPRELSWHRHLYHLSVPRPVRRRLNAWFLDEPRRPLEIAVKEERAPTAADLTHTLDERKRDIGYHAFNLHGFATIKRNHPDHPFWSSPKLRRALRYAESSRHIKGLEDNVYGYPYNPVGFEVAWALESFEVEATDRIRYWVGEQIRRHFDPDRNLLCRGCNDPDTLAARIYEATYLSNVDLRD